MIGAIPREFIDLLLAKVDLVDLINTQLPLRKKSGSNYFACCPFHNEKSASFSVSQTKQFYYCFGCGAHGNAIDFMIQHDRLSFPEAIEALATYAGMELPQTNEMVKKNRSSASLHELLKQVATYYYEQMRHSNRAIHYLKHRGISGTIAQQFSLGYAPNSWNHLLDQFGKTETDKKNLLDVGLIVKRDEGGYYDRFRDRILFPIHDYRGRIIGFGGRIIEQGEPKYLNSPETILFQKGHELYGLHHAIKSNRKLDRMLIVEGYMDVLALFQHNITYAVATLGTATTQHHLQRLFRYTSEIIFCFDGDPAGRNAAWRALQVILPMMQDDLQIRFLFLPDGEDPDSLIRKIEQTQFEKLLLTALSLSNFFFQSLSQQGDITTMEGRAGFAANAISYIKQIPPCIFQGILMEELSKRARVDLNKIKQQMGHSNMTGISKPSSLAPSQPLTKLPAALRLALALLIQHPHLSIAFSKTLLENDLSGYPLLTHLIELTQQKPQITPGGLIEYWRGDSEESLIAELANWHHLLPNNSIESGFLGAIRQLSLFKFDNEINGLLSKAAGEGLSESEKLKLADCISKKKTLNVDDDTRK